MISSAKYHQSVLLNRRREDEVGTAVKLLIIVYLPDVQQERLSRPWVKGLTQVMLEDDIKSHRLWIPPHEIKTLITCSTSSLSIWHQIKCSGWFSSVPVPYQPQNVTLTPKWPQNYYKWIRISNMTGFLFCFRALCDSNTHRQILMMKVITQGYLVMFNLMSY